MSDGWFYFGCHGEAGHYLFMPGMLHVYNHALSLRFDGSLCRKETTPFIAALSRLGGLGYSALAFWDYSVDSRPGSNSIFFAPSLTASAETIVIGSQKYFPQVWRRIPELRLHSSCEAVCAIDRDTLIEQCAVAAEAQDRAGYEWVQDSLWANILKRAGANVRKLKGAP